MSPKIAQLFKNDTSDQEILKFWGGQNNNVTREWASQCAPLDTQIGHLSANSLCIMYFNEGQISPGRPLIYQSDTIAGKGSPRRP